MAKKGEVQQQQPNNIDSNGVYLLMDQITYASCKDAIKWIMNHNLSDNPLPK